MTNVIDWILDLFRDPVAAQAFVNDPDRAMANAGVSGVTTAQVNAVAATVAPAAVIHGGGNPVHGLQQAVAETHGIAFTPQYAPSFAPEAFSNNDSLSHNDTLSNNDTLSHNDVLSPNAGHDVQQGGVNLDFGDITFGNKNTASDGSVINTGNAGDIDNTNVHGHGNVVGDGNVGANTGDILAGEGSTVQGEPGRDLAVELSRVGALDPGADVGEREDPEEVDVDGVPALLRERLAEPVQQRGLAVAPRCQQAAVVTAHRRRDEARDLRVAVDQLGGRHRLAIAEWVHLPAEDRATSL